MATSSLHLAGGPFTRVDLDATPDDGRRYELIDGAMVVTPAPSPHHQRVSRSLFRLLDATCPGGFEVFYAPLDVSLDDGTVLQPDLLVARSEDFTDLDLPVPPLLAVEVLSPSTRRIDLTLKRARYEAAGTPSYWVVDPDELTLTTWQLVDGRYVEAAQVAGDEMFSAASPFAVEIVPARLRD